MASRTTMPTGIHAPTVMTGAHTIVAHAMGREPPPLGLDRPLALLGGGDRLLPIGMASAPGIDRVPGLRAFVAEACRRSAAAGGEAYRQPPLALLGERGVGKGLVAAWIATHAGIPLFRMRVDATGAGVGLQTDIVARPLPSFPIMAMAASRCANPIIVVELDVDAPPSAKVEETLVSMIDPRRSSRWVDETTGSIVDLSNVSWMIEVHGRPLRRSGLRHPDEQPVVSAVLPFRLEAIVQEVGTVLHMEARTGGEDLRRLDVAAFIGTASGVDEPDTVGALFAALLRLSEPQGTHLPCEQLVRHAIGWIAERRSGRTT